MTKTILIYSCVSKAYSLEAHRQERLPHSQHGALRSLDFVAFINTALRITEKLTCQKVFVLKGILLGILTDKCRLIGGNFYSRHSICDMTASRVYQIMGGNDLYRCMSTPIRYLSD